MLFIRHEHSDRSLSISQHTPSPSLGSKIFDCRRANYPLHPAIFDSFYNRLSNLIRLQRLFDRRTSEPSQATPYR